MFVAVETGGKTSAVAERLHTLHGELAAPKLLSRCDVAMPFSIRSTILESFSVLFLQGLLAMFLLCTGVACSAASAYLSGHTTSAVVFVQGDLADRDVLVPDSKSNTEVVVLDPRRDGLVQIARALSGRNQATEVHVISHGSPGAVELGSLRLTEQLLATRKADLALIRSQLAPGAEVLLYGCNVAKDLVGEGFVNALEEALAVRVAASTNFTGSADQGGDWVLERRGASGGTPALEFANFRHLLVCARRTHLAHDRC